MSRLEDYGSQLEVLARELGLDYYPVHFEEVPDSFMMEIAVYGLPVRMPHWSFGVRYIHQLVQHRMGHSRLFEVVFPGNPGRAYLARGNNLPENTLVVAHVIGHADFSKNNALFRRSQEQVGYRFVDQAAQNARRIADAIEEHGQQRVEQVLDAALALEAHIDTHRGLERAPYASHAEERQAAPEGLFGQRYSDLPGEAARMPEPRRRLSMPPHPEHDLLWFIASCAPDLDDWERDIFLAVREESFYFYPVFACQIMNEGWASYWHARLLREADFIGQGDYVDAIRTHSDVVRPHAVGSQVSLSVNPYHLGFSIWERIVRRDGLERAMEIRAQDDDAAFIRNHLDEELAAQLGLFRWREAVDDSVEITTCDIDGLREAILAVRYNFGAPSVAANQVDNDGSLELVHEFETDGRGLDVRRAEKVLQYVQRVWRRPVRLQTLDVQGRATMLKAPA